MSASSVATPPQTAADERVVLPSVSWETYERLLADDEERRAPRMTYDQGVLELVTPSMPHEEDADTIATIVKIVAETLDIPIRSVRSTTFRRQDLHRGSEPDASFYIQSEERIRGRRQVHLSVDPPPDLILVMETSRSALDKLALFAPIGIPEVWRCDGERVLIFVLEQGRCESSPASRALAMLTSHELTRLLAKSRSLLSTDRSRTVRDRARVWKAGAS